MDLAQGCDPNLRSSDRNLEVNTEARGDTEHHYLGVHAGGRCLSSHAMEM